MTETEDTGKGEERKLTPRTVVAIAAAIVIISIGVYVFYDLNGHSLDPTDREAIIILTDSMDGDNTEYAIHSFPMHTMVMVKHLSEEEKKEIQVGDVISFHYKDKTKDILIHHRVIAVHFDDGYVNTQGDNRDVKELVYLEDINGEVVGTNHWLGELAYFVKNYVFFILAAFCVLMILWILKDEFPRKKTPKEV